MKSRKKEPLKPNRIHTQEPRRGSDAFADYDRPRRQMPPLSADRTDPRRNPVPSSADRTDSRRNPAKSADRTDPRRRQPDPPRREKRCRHYFLRFLGKFAIVLLVILGLLIGAGYLLIGHCYDKMTYAPIESVASEPIRADGVVNILLIGNDSRTGEDDGRSDAMILLSVSRATGKIQMTSLLRDIYVEIPGHDPNRLNAAYAFGGAELLMETIEQNFGIEVNRYMTVNFEAFANLVDSVGGVDLELTNEEVKWVNAYLNEYNELTGQPFGTYYLDDTLSGTVHLNGPQALAYSRNRYIGSDFERTNRQRKVISAVMEKLPSAMTTNAEGVIDGLCTNLTTNLTQGEILRLMPEALHIKSYSVESCSIPQEGTWTNDTQRGMAVLSIDFEKNREFLQESLYGK